MVIESDILYKKYPVNLNSYVNFHGIGIYINHGENKTTFCLYF